MEDVRVSMCNRVGVSKTKEDQSVRWWALEGQREKLQNERSTPERAMVLATMASKYVVSILVVVSPGRS